MLLLYAVAIAGTGCEETPRIPYIPPTLANWPQPYRGVPGLKVHVFTTGSVRLPEALLLRGGSLTRTRDLPVPVFVIEHPKEGLILFNSGVRDRAPDDTQSLWGSLGLGSEVVPGEALPVQMRRAGLSPEAVRWIVFSSLRPDHTGGAKDFPQARAVVARAEQEAAGRNPDSRVAAAVAGLTDWKRIDFSSAAPLATFTAHVDLFGDGSCVLLDASGTTPGTMALLVRLNHRPLLLADDLAAVEENLRYTAWPAFTADAAQWWDHIWRLKRFQDLVPELIVVPGHDLGPLREVRMPEIIVHASHVPTPTPLPTPTVGLLQRILPPM